MTNYNKYIRIGILALSMLILFHNGYSLDYGLTVASDTHEALIIHEDCSQEQYILNIYVLDNKYNHTADLRLNDKWGREIYY